MGDFFDFENLMNHLHGALNHFPIALLFVSAGLDFVAWKRPNLRSSAWLLLVLGTLGAIAATVSGLLAHLAYEDDPYLLSAMEVHQLSGLCHDGPLRRPHGLVLAFFEARLGRRREPSVSGADPAGSGNSRRHGLSRRKPPLRIRHRGQGHHPLERRGR